MTKLVSIEQKANVKKFEELGESITKRVESLKADVEKMVERVIERRAVEFEESESETGEAIDEEQEPESSSSESEQSSEKKKTESEEESESLSKQTSLEKLSEISCS